jgi:hypothetical protein
LGNIFRIKAKSNDNTTHWESSDLRAFEFIPPIWKDLPLKSA